MNEEATFPSEVSTKLSWFDKFATTVSRFVSRAWFFAACVFMIVIWFPSYFLFDDKNSWQLVVNTGTTILTFLLLALLENTQSRDSQATHHKLNAIADALADHMGTTTSEEATAKIAKDIEELKKAVGLENRE